MTTSVKIYGIKTCDTVKKARRWLDENALPHRFHDFRTDGLDSDLIEKWQQSVAVTTLLNKRSTTWKNLDASVRDTLKEEDIPALLIAHPTLVKRPVLEAGGKILVGFSDKTYSTLLD